MWLTATAACIRITHQVGAPKGILILERLMFIKA